MAERTLYVEIINEDGQNYLYISQEIQKALDYKLDLRPPEDSIRVDFYWRFCRNVLVIETVDGSETKVGVEDGGLELIRDRINKELAGESDSQIKDQTRLEIDDKVAPPKILMSQKIFLLLDQEIFQKLTFIIDRYYGDAFEENVQLDIEFRGEISSYLLPIKVGEALVDVINSYLEKLDVN